MRIKQSFPYALTLIVVASVFIFHANEYADAQSIKQIESGIQAMNISGPDFNGDGFADIPVGAPGSFHAGHIGAGSVSVLYGPHLNSSKNQRFHQGSPGIIGANERMDYWGESLSYGDFNADGFDDLVVAAPREDIGQTVNSGSVWILYGSDSGLRSESSWGFNQASSGIPGVNEENDLWGSALVSGDFNGDSYADLVIGAPYQDVGELVDAGSILVLLGGATGLSSLNAMEFHQDTDGVPGANEAGDLWGNSLASADFNGDGYDDVIVGAPGESIGVIENAGAFTVMFGSEQGLNADGSILFHQGTPGIPGGPEEGDHWAETLTTGDFDGDGYSDLAVGNPDESIGTKPFTGAVTLLYGWEAGFEISKSKLFHQGSPKMAGGNEPNDKWGSVLETGDFDGDGFHDLAIGTPNESIGSILEAGAVTFVYGSSTGLDGRGSRLFHQNTSRVPGGSELADHWGDSIMSADLNADGRSDVLVSSSAESIGTAYDTGFMVLLKGSYSGITSYGAKGIHQNSYNIPGSNRNGDYWGRLGADSWVDSYRPPKGVVTPSGVNVMLLSNLDEGLIVRTPCGKPRVVSSGSILENIDVVVDPGHGGSVDPGAVQNGIIERDINLTIANELLTELSSRGITAFSVRTANYHIPLSVRSAFADQLQAQAMVSIHHNSPSAPSSSSPGTESYIQSNSQSSLRLGNYVQNEVFESLSDFTEVNWVSRSDAGVLKVLNSSGRDTYGMLSRPKIPTTLVELAYISNTSESNLVKTDNYKVAVASALATALENYLTPASETEQFSTGTRTFNAGVAPGVSLCSDPTLE